MSVPQNTENRKRCEDLMRDGKYQEAAELCRDCRSRGAADGFWTVTLAEAYLAMGRSSFAEELVDACLAGSIPLEGADADRIREMKARLLFQKGDAATAYEIMEQICETYPDQLRFQMTFAAMCLSSGRTEEAARIYRALQHDPKYPGNVTYQLGRCAQKQGEWLTAHALFAQACTQDPGRYQTLYELIRTSVEAGNMEQAQREIDRSYGRLPERYRTYLKGRIRELEGDDRGAKALYQALIEKESRQEARGDRELMHQAYERYFLMKKRSGANRHAMIRELRRALKHEPDCVQMWMMLGKFQEEEGQMQEAVQCYEKAHREDPYDQTALDQLIRYAMKEKNWRAALVYCDRMIANTQKAEYYLIQAECAVELEMDTAFSGDLAAFLEQGGEVRKTYRLRSIHAIRKGEVEQALMLCEKELESGSDRLWECYDRLAVCLCKTGQGEEAEALLQKAVKEAGCDPFLLQRLYEIQLSIGRFKRASRTLKRIKGEHVLQDSDEKYRQLDACMMLEQGRFAAAYRKARRMRSQEGKLLCAVLNLLSRQYRRAARLLKQLIEQESDHLEYYSWMILCQALWGKRNGAEEYARQGLNVFAEEHTAVGKRDRPDRLCQYAFLLYFTGKPQQAYELFEKAGHVVPCHDRLCRQCYKACYVTGLCKAFDADRQAAEAAFAAALEIHPYNMVCRKLSEHLLKAL